ncbi:helix-turn-helix domain-containing protein [Romboutsia sp.]|uniref:helix-turn-helix domain-containing protein n=1 Tax=Romboutsia sp. TaxID=1965302 RepID=UPI003F2F4013
MDYNAMIGLRIKELRNQKNFTLKYLSEQTNLSTGFLSQLERGMTNVAVDSLAKIAKVLDVDLVSFLDFKSDNDNSSIIRSYDRKYTTISSEIVQCSLNHNVANFDLLPRIQEIMPNNNDNSEPLELYTHEGEEFIYVIEGILTIHIDCDKSNLYPGDCAHIKSFTPHNWRNDTSMITKILTVNIPNPFKK